MNVVQTLTLTMLLAAGGGVKALKYGKCPKPPVQPNFDVNRYLGKWFEIQRLSASFLKGQCNTIENSPQSTGVFGITSRRLLDNGTVRSIYGKLKVKDPAEPAKLEISFSTANGDIRLVSFWVLSTDYERYSLVFSCTKFGPYHLNLAWIMSRQPTLPRETTEYLLGILSSIGVNVDKMVATIQDKTHCSPMYQ